MTVSHSIERVPSLTPQQRYHWVGLTVNANDALALVQFCVDAKGQKLRLELVWPHAVTRTQNRGLTHETLVVRNLLNRHTVDRGSHDLIDVLPSVERIHEVILPCQPRQGARFDLAAVAVDKGIALRCHHGLLER